MTTIINYLFLLIPKCAGTAHAEVEIKQSVTTNDGQTTSIKTGENNACHSYKLEQNGTLIKENERR